jgi:hypothetical protein
MSRLQQHRPAGVAAPGQIIAGLVFSLALIAAVAASAQEVVQRLPEVTPAAPAGEAAPTAGMTGGSDFFAGPDYGVPPAESPPPPTVLPPARMLSRPLVEEEPWTWQVLPEGIIYHSYLADTKEPRFASQWVYGKETGSIWDVTLGGRVGLVRFGTEGPDRPEGWELDMEGAAFPRLNLEESLDVEATDFRFGLPLTYGIGPYQFKFAFYHISSHLGDELMLKHKDVPRINYSRNGFAWGNSYFLTRDVRLYAEAAWSFYCDGGAKPWEFLFGAEYSPAKVTGRRPVPFLAVNSHLREEVNYGGNVVVETGYQWRGVSDHLFRAGMQYSAGKSDQYEFFTRNEEKVGLGLWYDF